MPYYPDINTLFIHIPRTGGTSLENFLKTKSRQFLYCTRHFHGINGFHGCYDNILAGKNFKLYTNQINSINPGNWKIYINDYPDLREHINNKKKAIEHWRTLGYYECRKFGPIISQYDKFKNINKNFEISLQHQPFSIIYKHRELLNVNFNNIKIITIVRNPYDRIISDLFYFQLIEDNFSPRKISNIIKKYINEHIYDNHNLPQYKFISNDNGEIIDSIHIFKTETLTEDLNKYGYNYVRKKIGKEKRYTTLQYSNYLSNKSIDLINIFPIIFISIFKFNQNRI